MQRERIRLSLLRTDPIGVVQRWQRTVKRRQYNVKLPLSLWQIDGNHKAYKVFLILLSQYLKNSCMMGTPLHNELLTNVNI